jgi:NhaP-type Na+/H+ or K+/H+ antiporter
VLKAALDQENESIALQYSAGYSVDSEGQYDLRFAFVARTLVIVLFSILVQGTTIGPMIQRARNIEDEPR